MSALPDNGSVFCYGHTPATKDTIMNQQSNQYRSYDLGLASALVQVGFPLLGLDRGNGKKVEFIFTKTTELEEAVRRFWSGELMVDAQGYFEAIRSMKNRIYSSE